MAFLWTQSDQKDRSILKRAFCMSTYDYVNDHGTLLIKSGLSSLELQQQKFLAIGLIKIKSDMAPAYLVDLVQGTNMLYDTRSKHNLNFAVPTVKNIKF